VFASDAGSIESADKGIDYFSATQDMGVYGTHSQRSISLYTVTYSFRDEFVAGAFLEENPRRDILLRCNFTRKIKMFLESKRALSRIRINSKISFFR
jgi:hypothetical protein